LISGNYDGLLGLLVTLIPLVFLQRRLHSEIQTAIWIVFRRDDFVHIFFSLLFFPGVLIHEFSHWLMAAVLGVRRLAFSLVPRRLDDGTLLMGYVVTEKSDILRGSLIGVAPLLAGAAAVYYTGLVRLGLQGLWNLAAAGNLVAFFDGLLALPYQPDFWLYFYITVAISSMMLPSAPDRKSWLPVFLLIGALVILALLFNVAGAMLLFIWLRVDAFLGGLAIALAVGSVVHLVFLPLVMLLRIFLFWVLGPREE
jgi:hypothetical protein